MKPHDELPSLKGLEEGIRRFQSKTEQRVAPKPQDAGLAMRMGLELVAGVMVGAGAGIVLDRWLGTKPWLLVICFFLGAAGGALNLYRVAQSQVSDENNKVNESDKQQ